jgi:hypothetical protein
VRDECRCERVGSSPKRCSSAGVADERDGEDEDAQPLGNSGLNAAAEAEAALEANG